MIQQRIKPLIDTAKNWLYWFNNDDVINKINRYKDPE